MTRLGHRCGIMLLCKRLACALVVGIREDGALAAMPWPLGATHRQAALCPAGLTISPRVCTQIREILHNERIVHLSEVGSHSSLLSPLVQVCERDCLCVSLGFSLGFSLAREFRPSFRAHAPPIPRHHSALRLRCAVHPYHTKYQAYFSWSSSLV